MSEDQIGAALQPYAPRVYGPGPRPRVLECWTIEPPYMHGVNARLVFLDLTQVESVEGREISFSFGNRELTECPLIVMRSGRTRAVVGVRGLHDTKPRLVTVEELALLWRKSVEGER